MEQHPRSRPPQEGSSSSTIQFRGLTESIEHGDSVLSKSKGRSSNTRECTIGSVAILGDHGKFPVLDVNSYPNGKLIPKLLGE